MRRTQAMARTLWLLFVFALMPAAFSTNVETNRLRVGLFPFETGGSKKLEAWSLLFPSRLEDVVMAATPPKLYVYFQKVLERLTNHGWDGRQAVSRELADKIAGELRGPTKPGDFRGRVGFGFGQAGRS